MLSTFFFAVANPAPEIMERFGFNKQLFTMHLVGFAVVAFALHRWAYKPVLAMLDERRNRIAKSLADAEQIKQDLANAQTKSQEILNQASAQSNKMIEEARNGRGKGAGGRNAESHCRGKPDRGQGQGSQRSRVGAHEG